MLSILSTFLYIFVAAFDTELEACWMSALLAELAYELEILVGGQVEVAAGHLIASG